MLIQEIPKFLAEALNTRCEVLKRDVKSTWQEYEFYGYQFELTNTICDIVLADRTYEAITIKFIVFRIWPRIIGSIVIV